MDLGKNCGKCGLPYYALQPISEPRKPLCSCPKDVKFSSIPKVANLIQLTDIPLTWLDVCAFSAMKDLIDGTTPSLKASFVATNAYDYAEAMLAEKRKREGKK